MKFEKAKKYSKNKNKLRSEKAGDNEKVYNNDSERLIAEALEKMKLKKNSENNRRLKSDKIEQNETVYRNDSERLIAVALEKMKIKRDNKKAKNSFASRNQAKYQKSDIPGKPSDETNSDSEHLIELANITEFFKI